ncbi:MAG TPA: hypothetical protein VJ802_13780 [Gemmatimonadaceae bacterium]|nr:hypothetical protein [Gemmatimonadaceae bacterium]
MPRVFPVWAVRCIVVLAAALATACGDSPTGPAIQRLAVLSGAGASDTVFAILPNPLVVLVRDEAGMPALGVPVRFEVLRPAFPTNSVGAFLATNPERTGSGLVVIDTTDANGESRIYVRLGTLGGPVQIVVDAPSLGLSTSTTFTVLPGAPTGVRVLPGDSAMYVGRSYNLRGAVIDRWGNARPDPVTYISTANTIVNVDGSGRLTGTAIGRRSIVVAANAFRDTAFVSVVPEGVIATHRIRVSSLDTAAVVFTNLDGSGYEVRPLVYWAQPRPDWSGSGDAIVIEDAGALFGEEISRLVTMRHGDGSTVPLSSSPPAGNQFYPQYSADGEWIYFAEDPPGGGLDLWRVRADGSGAERLGPQVSHGYNDTKPSASPDGGRVVFVSDRLCCSQSLFILHIDSRAIDTLRSETGANFYGDMPRWSPVDDDRIAYVDNRIWLTSASGGVQQAITPAGKRYVGGIDWSPDGRWIIARSADDGFLHLIEVSTGLTLPLAFTGRLWSPAWRP